MVKLLATIKAIFTRVVFACHGIIAIWQVTIFKEDLTYWYLAVPILLLVAEGLFTLTIKENQEWKWFCPSVFIYLGTVVPAIWLLELHKVEKRLQAREDFNLTAATGIDFKDLNKMLGGKVHIPDIPFNTETWVTLIEQFLMLTLIVGRWLLPKGDLTRDQLSQLLLVYIGTAADIIEFFDSFKDDKIASEPLLVLLTLAIWSWSLLQFTVVLTATKSRKSRVSANGSIVKSLTTQTCCCSIDVCAIVMNIALQDAPFLTFRLLIIIHYRIVSYMNVFFTCKNTLVILLQIYRLYVVHSETTKGVGKKATKAKKTKSSSKATKGKSKRDRAETKTPTRRKVGQVGNNVEVGNIAIISDPKDIYKLNHKKNITIKAFICKNKDMLRELDLLKAWSENETSLCINVDDGEKSRKSDTKDVKSSKQKKEKEKEKSKKSKESAETAKSSKTRKSARRKSEDIYVESSGSQSDQSDDGGSQTSVDESASSDAND